MDTIAVLLPTYNGEANLLDMLESLEKQTYNKFTCYIHDDGSSDSTELIIDAWIEKHPKKYIKLEYAPVHGMKENFFSMARAVDADFYFLADQDDVWLPEKIEKLLACAKVTQVNSRIPVCVYCDQYITDSDLNIIEESYVKSKGHDINRNKLGNVLIENPAGGASMCINQALVDKALVSKDYDGIIRHDHWFMLVACACGLVGVVDEPLVYHKQRTYEIDDAPSTGFFGKLRRTTKDVTTPEYVKRQRDYHAAIRRQALLLLRVSGISMADRNMLAEFAKLDTSDKIARMEFYIKHDIISTERPDKMLWV